MYNFSNVNLSECSREEMNLVKEKVHDLKQEQSELICQSIKFCIKMMSKIIESIENFNKSVNDYGDLLMKIKLFLKITRMVAANAKNEIQQNEDSKKRVFFDCSGFY